MTVFADSSAVVELYADEDGADVVRQVPVHVVSAVARVEVPVAMWRKARTRALSVEDVTILVAAFAADWRDPVGRSLPVGLRGRVLERTRRPTAPSASTPSP